MTPKICFLSSYLTHHQLPFCLEMMTLTQGRFVFVETEQLPEERKNMGYAQLGKQHDFVICACESPEKQALAKKMADDAEIVIAGSAPDSYIRNRLKQNKLTFRYSERIFKRGYFDILRQLKYTLKTLPYRNKNLYYLLSSAYAAHDYYRCGAKPEKMFKWGYFPECIFYEDKNTLFANKQKASILWAGRLLDWKHPEAAIRLAARLKQDGYTFTMQIIGNGEKEQSICEMIQRLELQNCVEMTGAMNAEEVRHQMEKSQIYLCTSDYNEGWGAVVNEAMNSGCAVVASHACGSVPFLVEHGLNGLIYESENEDQLYSLVTKLLQEPALCRQLGENALNTICESWSAKIAANKLMALCNSAANIQPLTPTENSGVTSFAKPIRQDKMYTSLRR